MALVALSDVEEAMKLLAETEVVKTPLLEHAEAFSKTLAATGAAQVALKFEHMQVQGSFKMRGVLNQLAAVQAALSGDSPPAGICTMSAGNYGRAFAYATRDMPLPRVVIMPSTVPAERAEAIGATGCEVRLVESVKLMEEVASLEAEGFRFLHPFDDRQLIAGYGAIGMELLEQLGETTVDIVAVGCGGGGHLSGIAVALRASGFAGRIYGVEPSGAAAMRRSLEAGEAVTLDAVSTVAAGLAPPFAGKITYEHVKELVDDVIEVEDDDIAAAVATLYREVRQVVEPSGAAVVAALCSGRIPDVEGKRVALVLSGGNVDAQQMASLLARADEVKAE